MTATTRRALVLTHEAARHWFRRSLPRHVFYADTEEEVAAQNAAAARSWRVNGGDWRGFLSAYCASFVAIAIFIA